MLALSIRQPWAELILRGIKTVEYRSRPTRVIGERFWIYATRKEFPVPSGQLPVRKADNIIVPTEQLPPWMYELAEALILKNLPRGVIVGSAVISDCTRSAQRDGYQWHLADVERVKRFRKPKRQPQPVWFRPF